MLARLDISQFITKLTENFQESNLFSVLSNHKYGVVLIKEVLKIANNNMNTRYEILQVLMDNFSNLAFNEYGHYIIEELFQYYNYYEVESLLSYMSTYITYISQNQFSSSIIRKTIELFGDYVCIPYLQVLIAEENREQNIYCGVHDLMEDKSGSFVLHRLIEQTQDKDMKEELLRKMKLQVPKMKVYEKKQKWMKFFNLWGTWWLNRLI